MQERFLFICFIYLFLLFPAFGEELSFLDIKKNPDLLKTKEQKEVSIRGFVCFSDEFGWVLCAEPGVKTCCLGKKEGSYIVLEGDFKNASPSRAIKVSGRLAMGEKGVCLLRPL